MRGVGVGIAAWALALIVSLLDWRGTDVPDLLFYPALGLLIVLTLVGLYLFVIEVLPKPERPERTTGSADMQVQSWHQRGGITAGKVNIDRKKDGKDGG